MYLWRNGYVQKIEKCTAVASKVADALAHPSYATRKWVSCSPLNKNGQPAAPYPFLRREVPRAAVGRAFASLLRAQKWAPYTLLYRDVNASTAEVAEVPREREVNCDAFAVLYRVGGWAFGCKMRRKRELKELCLQIALLLITRFEWCMLLSCR